ncbi:MAG: hypothetical protein L6367_17815 [Cellulomonas sp.]|nr:hypothetical protein [Cellulomonas sp.]
MTRVLVYGLPLIAGASCWRLGWDLTDSAGSLIGGFSLVAGILIAVFVQLASWRTRLDDRAKTHLQSEAPARRSVDAAVAHSLVGVLASLLAVVACVVVGAGVAPRPVWAAVAVSLGAFVLAVFVLIVKAVYVSYESNVDADVRHADDQLLRVPTHVQPAQGMAAAH